MPKLIVPEKQQPTLTLGQQLRWALFDIRHGMLPYIPMRKRNDGLVHAAFHWTEFPRWLRVITGR